LWSTSTFIGKIALLTTSDTGSSKLQAARLLHVATVPNGDLISQFQILARLGRHCDNLTGQDTAAIGDEAGLVAEQAANRKSSKYAELCF